MKKSIMVVDVQNDFINGTLSVSKGEEVVPIINRLITSSKFNYIIFSQDAHPAYHKSFASNHKDKKIGDIINIGGVQQTLWPDHCVFYSEGAKLHANLLTGKADLIFRKGMNPDVDSYSAFFDNVKHTTGLAEFLKANEIDEIYVAGIALDYCVRYTALDSIGCGFKTYLIEDGCRAVNIKPTDGQEAIEEMKKAGVIITNEKEVLK